MSPPKVSPASSSAVKRFFRYGGEGGGVGPEIYDFGPIPCSTRPRGRLGFPTPHQYGCPIAGVPGIADSYTLCYALVLPGRKSGFRAGFRPDSMLEDIKIGPSVGRRPPGGTILRLSRIESDRNPFRKADLRPGSIIVLRDTLMLPNTPTGKHRFLSTVRLL